MSEVIIDEIMEMLDWNQPPEIQQAGREAAARIRSINVFLQPSQEGRSKNVWENCALILSEKTDAELRPYIHHLFEWLADMNWPGADHIWRRLVAFEDRNWLEYVLDLCLSEALATDDEIWQDNLHAFNEAPETWMTGRA